MFSMISSLIRREVISQLKTKQLNQMKNTSKQSLLNQFNEKPLLHEMMSRLSISSHKCQNGSTTSSTSSPAADRWWETPVHELATREQWAEQRLLYGFKRAGVKIRSKPKHPLDGKPQMKGIVLKTMIKKPKKPNSANRKCVLVRLTNGKEKIAFIPGEGHNLQEHSVVLVQKKRVRDVPGLKLRVIRGVYDCAHIVKKTA